MSRQFRATPEGWQRWAGRALDFLYPPLCEICGVGLKHGRALCEPCAVDLPRLAAPFCKSCGEAFEGEINGEFACPNCAKLKFSFEFARPAMVRDPRTLDLIHRLKYGREIHLAAELGRLGQEAFSDTRLEPALIEKWPLVPVPLYYKRQQVRHFNQAHELARAIAIGTELPLLDALQRIRSTETQTLLSRKQRLENLRGAFSLTRRARKWIENNSSGAILIDDVLTTGSTVDECAKVLRQGGFKRVFVLTIMRG